MFGLELQTSGNIFISGVQDREVAYEHDSGFTIEGDETLTPGATSELEFVTRPCGTLGEARKAVKYAADVAAELAQLAKKPGQVLAFNEGEAFLGGKWVKKCQVKLGDLCFTAKPQGTAGIPLARLRPFIERVLGGLGREGVDMLNDLAGMRKLSGFGFSDDDHPELNGFLTACQIFLWSATANFTNVVATDDEGRPLLRKDPDFWRVFTFDKSPYLEKFRLRDRDIQAFSKEKKGGACMVLVHRDSPKSGFKLLHRTDFCSMYNALSMDQRTILAKLQVSEGVPVAVWPEQWQSPDRRLFVFPYRAEPTDQFDKEVVQHEAGGWSGDGVTREEKCWLKEHGPLMSEWWASVVSGRPVPGRSGGEDKMLKDLASPPPGIRGRDPGRIDKFPGADENKRDYYGMGAFPMDRPEGEMGAPPLAVYEHRGFADDDALRKLGPTCFSRWNDIAELFYDQFVAPFA